jgi:hypothetical protein
MNNKRVYIMDKKVEDRYGIPDPVIAIFLTDNSGNPGIFGLGKRPGSRDCNP